MCGRRQPEHDAVRVDGGGAGANLPWQRQHDLLEDEVEPLALSRDSAPVERASVREVARGKDVPDRARKGEDVAELAGEHAVAHVQQREQRRRGRRSLARRQEWPREGEVARRAHLLQNLEHRAARLVPLEVELLDGLLAERVGGGARLGVRLEIELRLLRRRPPVRCRPAFGIAAAAGGGGGGGVGYEGEGGRVFRLHQLAEGARTPLPPRRRLPPIGELVGGPYTPPPLLLWLHLSAPRSAGLCAT
mmetsp:Transcript_39911/g.129203  ORF Transcript_39911/g.129203 Transcript_39911/m.129203 type:complete len:248 (-) Transcript_39911:213-956(-)